MAYTLDNLRTDIRNYTEVDSGVLSDTILDTIIKNTENKIYEVGSILNKRIIDYLPVQNNEKENFSILVLGGSQGAEIFGSIIPPVIKMIKNEGYKVEINQQCILNQKNSIVEYYKNNNLKKIF